MDGNRGYALPLTWASNAIVTLQLLKLADRDHESIGPTGPWQNKTFQTSVVRAPILGFL